MNVCAIGSESALFEGALSSNVVRWWKQLLRDIFKTFFDLLKLLKVAPVYSRIPLLFTLGHN